MCDTLDGRSFTDWMTSDDCSMIRSCVSYEHNYCIPSAKYGSHKEVIDFGYSIPDHKSAFHSQGIFVEPNVTHINSGYYEEENQFIVISEIGKGQFSNVDLCKDRVSGKMMARKKVSVSLFKAKEAEFLSTLSNANDEGSLYIPKLYGIQLKAEQVHLYLEYAESIRTTRYSDQWNFLKQLVSAVRYLHKYQIVHLDLKPDNIGFILQEQRVKLLDFGSAVQIDNDYTQVTNSAITPEYCPPEIFRCPTINWKKLDVWAAALCATYNVTGQDAWQNFENLIEDRIHRMRKIFESINNPLAMNLPKKYRNQPNGRLLFFMLQVDPSQRCTAEEAWSFIECEGDRARLAGNPVWQEYERQLSHQEPAGEEQYQTRQLQSFPFNNQVLQEQLEQKAFVQAVVNEHRCKVIPNFDMILPESDEN